MNLDQALATPADVCRVVCLLYGISIAVTFAEKLTRVGDYAASGWFPWRIFSFDRRHFAIFRRYPAVFDALFGRAGMTVLLCGGLAAVGVMWLAPVSSLPFTAAVATLVAASILIHLRATYGGDGSQQMNLVIGVAVLLGFNPWVRPSVGGVSLLFIAAQSCLAYFTSGVAKLVSPIWMRGDPLIGIMSTTAYGSDLALRMVSANAHARRIICLSMVVLETGLPVAIVAPQPVFYAYMLWGVAFHLSNAVFMGLNTFVWSFLATYPALWFAWRLLH